MQANRNRPKLSLSGAFRFESASGAKIQVSSKRARALLALLALAPMGERSRRWLESMLWGSRPASQAQASLRKEVFNLRRLIDDIDPDLIGADANAIWLDLDRLSIDVRDDVDAAAEVFLEGLDLEGEEAFEDWLRERRQEFATVRPLAATSDPVPRQSNPVQSDDLDFAIAVLPFEVEPPGEELEIAAFGLGEELISRISRLRWLPVIARSSSFAIAPEERNARDAGMALGARYVIEGTLKPLSRGFRFQIGLSDARSGQIIWSEVIKLERVDDPATIDAVLAGITAALDHRVDQSEQSRAVAAQADDGDIRQLIWQARWHWAKLTHDGMEEAARLLNLAQAHAPMSAEILIEQAWLTIRNLWLRRGTHEEIRDLRKLAQRASNADPDDARGYMVCGIAEFWLHQPARAERLLRRATELNPSLVMAHSQLGSSLHHRGEFEAAIATLLTAKRLSPNDQDLFFTEGELAMAHLALGRFDAAIDHAEASLARRAAYWSAHVAKINAHVRLEQWNDARIAHEELMAAQPQFRPHFIDWLPYQDASINAALRDGLNLARSLHD